MRRILTPALLLVALPVFAQPSPVGTWCQSLDKGHTCFEYMTFQADGTLLTSGQYSDVGMGFEGDATWAQQGNQTCISETRFDTYELASGHWVGEAYIPARCDTIIAISGDQCSYRKANGDTENWYRVKPNTPPGHEFTAGRN